MEFEDREITWPLGRSVVKGEIDNTDRKRISGWIWLKGRDEPLELSLKGDCMRDIAGCRIKFTNSAPRDGDDINLASLQTGLTGEMTASRKIQFLDKTLAKNGRNRMGNCLYLEWFSDVNGRVVIEGPDFKVDVVESAWVMTKDEEIDQVSEVALNMTRWEQEVRDYDSEDSEPRRLNEFEWEKNLRESDALTDRFAKVLEKYLDHPDCDQLIAREMGWTWLLEKGESGKGSGGAVDEFSDELMDDVDDDDFEMDPNPLTEGIDWMRGNNGRITHPLTNRSFCIAMDLWSYCKQTGNLADDADADVRDMIFQVQTLTAKLAGALDGLAYDVETDGGFVVACLKRALPYINRALASADSVKRKKLLEEARLERYRRKMLEVREEIIRLMSRYRKQAE